MDSRNSNSYVSFSRSETSLKRNAATESANRKLIRPSLTELREQQQQHHQQQQQQQQQQAQQTAREQRKPQKRPVPPDQTNAENFYYVKQMQARTPMVVVLNDGEEMRGIIEWYDRTCIKVNRLAGPNVLIYKANIKYLYKESDKNGDG